jgi:hypothetical protein
VESPGVSENHGSDAERDLIRERIELLAKSLLAFAKRATRPSRVSRRMAMPMSIPANACSPWMLLMIA